MVDIIDFYPLFDYFTDYALQEVSAGMFTRNFNTLGFQAQINVEDALRFSYTFELPPRILWV